MIEIVNVSKIFKDENRETHAVNNVSLKINKGEIHGIIGYSGAGKSTLVRCINLLERPTKGSIFFKGEDLTLLEERQLRDVRKNIGMIFQHFNLMHSRNVYKNVAYPLKGSNLTKTEEQARVRELLQLVGLKDKELSYPSQLSGGEKQRVAIARALANNPEVLLCDEATSALDPKTTRSILTLLKELQEKLGLTIVLITHEMAVIKEICNRVSIMENGKIIEEGDIVKVFSSPEHKTTRSFLATSTNKSRVIEILKSKKQEFNIGKNDVLTLVRYLGEATREPIISQASRNFNLDISVLYGNIEFLGDIPLGELIILFSGEHENINKGIEYFKEQGLKLEVIDYGVDSTVLT